MYTQFSAAFFFFALILEWLKLLEQKENEHWKELKNYFKGVIFCPCDGFGMNSCEFLIFSSFHHILLIFEPIYMIIIYNK